MSEKHTVYYSRHKEKVIQRTLNWRATHLTQYNMYQATLMRKIRVKKREQRMLAKGKCPFCEFLLDAFYHQQFPCQSYTNWKLEVR